MYNVIQFGDRKGKVNPWDLDLIRIRNIVDEDRWGNKSIIKRGLLDCENIIHVSQSDTRFGKRKLEFIFEIPTTAYNRNLSGYPKINDYKDTLNELGDTLNREFIGTEDENIDRFFIGYYILSYKIKGVTYTKEVTGETRTYQKVFWPDGRLKYNGFSEFMQDLFDYTNGRKSLSKKLTGHIFENIAFFSKELNDLGKTQDDVYDVKIASTFLGYKLRFPMKDEIDDEPGVDLYTALDMLHYVTIPENLTIYKKRSNLYGTYSTEYNHIMFQARDVNPMYKDLGFDIMLYYTVDIEDEDKKDFANRKIDIESMEYELGEEKSLEEKAEDEKKKN